MKIAVLTDSGCGLTKEQVEAKGLYFLPLQIIDGDNVYLDGVDTTTEQIFQMLEDGKMLKTSLPPIGLVEEMLEKMKEDGYEHLIFVPLSAGISGTMQAVKLAADNVGLPITCFEIYTTAFIQMYIAESAKRLVDEGLDIEEIKTRIQASIDDSNTFLIVENLDHLAAGGRLTPMAAKLGGMLKIKPILKLNESSGGKVDQHAKVRTMSKAIKQAVDTFLERGIDDSYVIAILHVNADEAGVLMKELYFDTVQTDMKVFGLLAPVIAAHTGTGAIGLQYIKKV
ncbi:DegV family protein with EDD domain [Breznakia blatticola]|uniref:DegV family protein with EDD domain n=1 Tax=Breznakia blatticola TaxID=1754012 RepID=A0A4R8A818_9FIRM|nr:DegV family protein [Breznakia blatticola]TDW25785.1 DegV family protein with EDD domain [Breznakia blatticola]